MIESGPFVDDCELCNQQKMSGKSDITNNSSEVSRMPLPLSRFGQTGNARPRMKANPHLSTRVLGYPQSNDEDDGEEYSHEVGQSVVAAP